MSKVKFSSLVKDGLNATLNAIGLQLGTTVAKQKETARLKRVRERGQWSRVPFAEGLRLNDADYLQFLENVCTRRKHLYSALPQTSDIGQDGYFLQNDWFSAVDAEVLCCVIDHFRPRNIIEVGSGYSTRLMRRTIREGNVNTTLTSIDPIPRVGIQACADVEIQMMVEDVPVSNFTGDLQPNDILFIDSSHVIQTGGDIPHLFLEVIPGLRAGVLIHVHDIFLPYEYPQSFVDEGWAWNEQYLFHAFMMGNRDYEILWPSYYMWQLHRSAIVDAFPSAASARAPSSFWIRKLSAS